MELLTRTLRSFRQVASHNGWLTFGAVVAVFVIELTGRRVFTTDWQDILVAAALISLAGVFAWRHMQSPLRWLRPVEQMLRAVGNWFKLWLVEVGYDVRGEPPVKRGMPPLVFGLAALCIGWGVVLLAFGDWFPDVFRFVGTNYFYIGYLAGMAIIWSGLLIAIGISWYSSVGLVYDELASNSDGKVLHGPSKWALAMGLVAMLFLASRYLTLGHVLIMCVVGWLTLTVISLLGGEGDVRFLWRPKGSIRVRSISKRQSEILMLGLATLVALNLTVTAAGSQIWSPLLGPTSMPLTIMLGTMLGWLLLALLWICVWQGAMERLRSPGRRARRVLHVHGAAAALDRAAEIRRYFRRRYWRIQYSPSEPDSCAVQIEIVPQDRSQAREYDPDWPLKVSLDDLADAEIRQRIERRSDIQVRRRLISGLERLFKIAKRRKYRNGHGFWVAPHMEIWSGLRRDEPEPEPGPFDTYMINEKIGPAYHRAFPRLARHLARLTLRALQVDLIFVEDGVTFRRFARVLRRMFELYDRQTGKPVEDRHFAGIPGTRVMIYEFQFDNPFESDVYPEPKFTTLGRARILLVFRDRSEQEELLEAPFDTSRTPAPLGGIS
jgi:hypothetical protein